MFSIGDSGLAFQNAVLHAKRMTSSLYIHSSSSDRSVQVLDGLWQCSLTIPITFSRTSCIARKITANKHWFYPTIEVVTRQHCDQRKSFWSLPVLLDIFLCEQALPLYPLLCSCGKQHASRRSLTFVVHFGSERMKKTKPTVTHFFI